jgi:hypothetical protein
LQEVLFHATKVINLSASRLLIQEKYLNVSIKPCQKKQLHCSYSC